MTWILLFDIVLALCLIVLAVAALRAEGIFRGIVCFIIYGLVMAMAWSRVGAPDLALAEGIIGAGITGALFLGALSRIERFGKHPAGEVASRMHMRSSAVAWSLVLCGVWTAALLATMVTLWQEAPSLRTAVEAELPNSGVVNPVTAVILNFRAYDTFIEIGVLLVACVAAYALAENREHGAAETRSDNPLLLAFARGIAPVAIVLAGYLLWVGYKAPGGAFQAGALLAGAGVVLLTTGYVLPIHDRRTAVRWAAALGFTVFWIAAIVLLVARGHLLDFPPRWAKYAILVIELACTVSIGAILAILFAACAGLIHADPEGGVMSSAIIYALAGALIVGMGLFHLLAQSNLLRKVMAANVLGSGAFLIIVSMANRDAATPADPVPHALVLTGIVVAVSATALLLLFVCRYQDATGRLTIDEIEDSP